MIAADPPMFPHALSSNNVLRSYPFLLETLSPFDVLSVACRVECRRRHKYSGVRYDYVPLRSIVHETPAPQLHTIVLLSFAP